MRELAYASETWYGSGGAPSLFDVETQRLLQTPVSALVNAAQ